MGLRAQLIPQVSSERINAIRSLINEIEAEIENGNNVDGLILHFNLITGKDYDKHYFIDYASSETLDEFAEYAALPAATRVEDISVEELVEIVELIKSADPHTRFYLDLLRANVNHPRVSDLIFWPQKEGLSQMPTSEEIVNAALAYKPIQL